MSRVGEMPEPPQASPEPIGGKMEESNPLKPDPQTNSEEDGGGKLASRIASMSGLEKREVIRRAQRKRRALGPVSLEVAMLLLAREQNLEMDRIMEMS